MFVRATARLLALASPLVLATTACHTPPVEKPVSAGERAGLERLQELQPTDVAVAPVRDQTSTQRVPLELFRNAFVETLVERRYSPLATEYVDANWMSASFKGTPPPDGLLVVAVTSWDPSHLYSTGRVRAGADVALYEGADSTGRVLWQRTIEHEVDMGDGRGNPPPVGLDLIPRAVRAFVQEALGTLPMRDPVAAYRAKTAKRAP